MESVRCVLDRFALSPGLDRLNLCKRYHVAGITWLEGTGGVLVLAEAPFGCGALMSATGEVVLEPLGKGSCVGQGHVGLVATLQELQCVLSPSAACPRGVYGPFII